MKKRILFTLFAFILSGCHSAHYDDRFVDVSQEDIKTYIVYDRYTKVMYVGHTLGGYCPLYNADGTLMLFEE